MPGLFHKLTDAQSSCLGGESVWAMDSVFSGENNVIKTGKKFITAKLNEMYWKMVQFERPNIYEILTEPQPVCLYLDIEISSGDENPFSYTESTSMVQFIKEALDRHLELSFPTLNIEPSKCVILHSCNATKFSIHIIHKGVVFEEHTCSCAAYVAEFVAFIKKEIDTSDRNDDAMVRLKENLDLIDQSVYKRNQQFRTLGSSKINKNRPLLIYDSIIDSWSDGSCFGFTQTRYTYATWISTLCSVVPHDQLPIKVKPSVHTQYRSITSAYHRIYVNLFNFDNQMDENGRFLRSRNSKATDVPRSSLLNVSFSSLTSQLMDDENCIVDEYKHVVLVSTLNIEDDVYCLYCETEVIDELLVPIGDQSSAKVMKTRSNEKAIHCFNCDTTAFIIECVNQYGFYASNNELILTPYQKLNWDGREDINFEQTNRLTFLDAPMGSGKTYVAEQYVRQLPKETSILSITFRISLARYMSDRFGFVCYLDDGAWFDCNKQHRFVVCLDSITKLANTIYDVVLIDEGTFVQYHLVAGTITHNLYAVFNQLRIVLQRAKKVIVMQFRMPDTTIEFYANMMQIDPFNLESVTKKKLQKPTTLQPLKLAQSITALTKKMINDYLEHYNLEDNRSSSPFVVFCSRVDYSLLLCKIFREVAKEEFGETAANRIKGIWGQVQNEEWNKAFLKSPNAMAMDCDVLILTSVLQAGHSLDTHFTTSYDILFNHVLSFREELQFISRLRYLGRSDTRTIKHAWIEHGYPNSTLANKPKIDSSLKYVYDMANQPSNQLLLGTLSAVISERADTINRHQELWQQEYHKSQTQLWDEDELMEDANSQKYGVDWIKKKLDEVLKGKGQVTVKTLLQMQNDKHLEDMAVYLDEGQFASVSKLIQCHLGANIKSIYEHIPHSTNTKEYFNVLTNLIQKGRKTQLISISSFSNALTCIYNFIAFLDYRLYLLNRSDVSKQRWWLLRLDYISNNSNIRTKLRIAELTESLCDYLELPNREYLITGERWGKRGSSREVFDLLERNNYDKIYNLIFTSKNRYYADKAKYTTSSPTKGLHTNDLLSKLFRKAGLKLNSRNSKYNPNFKNLPELLAMSRCLITEEHYLHYAAHLPLNIVESVEKLFACEKVIENTQSSNIT